MGAGSDQSGAGADLSGFTGSPEIGGSRARSGSLERGNESSPGGGSSIGSGNSIADTIAGSFSADKLLSAPVGGSGVDVLSRTSTRTDAGSGSGSDLARRVNEAPVGGSGVDVLNRTSTRTGVGEGVNSISPDSPTLRLTPDGLLLTPGTMGQTGGAREGSNADANGPLGGHPIEAPPAPHERPVERAPLVGPPELEEDPRTLLQLGLADVTRKSLLGI